MLISINGKTTCTQLAGIAVTELTLFLHGKNIQREKVGFKGGKYT